MLPGFAPVVLFGKCQPDYLAQNNVLIKRRDSSWRKIYEVLSARMRKLITARARKNKRTACMLANARQDHSIPLPVNALNSTNTFMALCHATAIALKFKMCLFLDEASC